jgi:hypothetical protein
MPPSELCRFFASVPSHRAPRSPYKLVVSGAHDRALAVLASLFSAAACLLADRATRWNDKKALQEEPAARGDDEGVLPRREPAADADRGAPLDERPQLRGRALAGVSRPTAPRGAGHRRADRALRRRRRPWVHRLRPRRVRRRDPERRPAHEERLLRRRHGRRRATGGRAEALRRADPTGRRQTRPLRQRPRTALRAAGVAYVPHDGAVDR